MKYIALVLFVLIPQLSKSQTAQKKSPNKATHSTINVIGRDLSSNEGSLVYFIGKIFYSSHCGKENYVLERVIGIETTGSTPQNLDLTVSTLFISEGNSNSLENWDTNAADDYSGVYNDLQNKPELYNKTEIDNLIDGVETNTGVSQNLSLDQNTLSISGGNSISFENWITNIKDEFSGAYDDLQNKPELYNKIEIDNLIVGIETTGSTPQDLILEGSTLSNSQGNSICLETCITTAEINLYEHQFSSLNGVQKDYTLDELVSTKAEILGVVSFFTTRNINSVEVSNTLHFTSSATLTNT